MTDTQQQEITQKLHDDIEYAQKQIVLAHDELERIQESIASVSENPLRFCEIMATHRRVLQYEESSDPLLHALLLKMALATRNTQNLAPLTEL